MLCLIATGMVLQPRGRRKLDRLGQAFLRGDAGVLPKHYPRPANTATCGRSAA